MSLMICAKHEKYMLQLIIRVKVFGLRSCAWQAIDLRTMTSTFETKPSTATSIQNLGNVFAHKHNKLRAVLLDKVIQAFSGSTLIVVPDASDAMFKCLLIKKFKIDTKVVEELIYSLPAVRNWCIEHTSSSQPVPKLCCIQRKDTSSDNIKDNKDL